MDWLKALASALGLGELFARRAQQQKDEVNGANAQTVADQGAALHVLADVSRPVAGGESEQLWGRNKAKYGEQLDD